MREIQYYLIHGVDKSRGPRMQKEFEKWNIPADRVKWMNHPNKNYITPELRKHIVNQNASISNNRYIAPGCPHLSNGQISCTYKHYLCIKDMVENNNMYGVIIEDNMYFTGDVTVRINTYIDQLNTHYPDWDVIFDSDWCKVHETEVKEGLYVYPKNNEITNICHGGTRGAPFYLFKKTFAEKLYKNYLPFNHAPDHYMNDLFRLLNIKSFWSEPPIAHIYPHVSTAN